MNITYSASELLKMLPKEQYNSKQKCQNNSILLTGASGFLGVHLLKELVLSQQYEKVFVIVRNIEKLKKQVIYYQLGQVWLNNIHFIESDLLDLDENDYPEVQYVIHGAAQIHCIKTLKQLWKNNVEVSDKIAQVYKNNCVFFISTLSVFVSSNQTGNHLPQSLSIDHNYLLYGGYAQSKYISEKIMEKYDHNIIRLGLITGSSTKGKFPKDFFMSFIEKNRQLNIYPEDYEQAWIDITPVDYCASLIAGKIKHDKKKIYHIANKIPTSLSMFIEILELKKVSKNKWLEEITTLSNIDQYLLQFAYYKSESIIKNFQYYNLDLFQTTGHSYNIENTFQKDNKNLLQLYIKNNSNSSLT